MKSTLAANEYLRLIYNATPIANIADNAATAPLASIWLTLHSLDPGRAGNATTNEIAYTGYARPAVARAPAGFTVTDDRVQLTAVVSFGAATAGSATAMFWSTTVAATGASRIIHKGPIGSRLGPFTVAAGDLAGDTILIPGLAGALAVNDRVVFHPASGSTLPAGIVDGTVYHVLSVATDVITISLTSGGTRLDITGVGDGLAYRVTPLVITSSPTVTPQLGTGTTIWEA